MRMGRDKASIGDPPWAHRVASALAGAGCTTVELQGGLDGLGALAWTQVPDIEPGGGPVPAIAQAAARHCGRPMVVAACDLPNLASVAVRLLLDAVGSSEHRAAAYRVGRRANWSLVALHPDMVAQLAVMSPAEVVGYPLQSLLSSKCTLLDPQDPLEVTDIDEPPAMPS